MRSSEWICFVYFAYLAVASWVRRLTWRRRFVITGVSAALLLAIPMAAEDAPRLARDWAPFVYISFGYYLTGWLFTSPSTRLENWLLDCDRSLFGDPTTRFSHWPRWLGAYLDLVYMSTFLLLPAGFIALSLGGHPGDGNRYWTMVAVADLGAFAPLSVIQTRPPWQLERSATLPAAGIHRAASLFVHHGTIGANTFPSGHVAVSLAVALGVIGSMPAVGAILLVFSASIAVACVVGRYHYAVDTLAGAAWGLLACALVSLIGR